MLTNTLLDMCRVAHHTGNSEADGFKDQILSYIVFASLMEHETALPKELEPVLVQLQHVVDNVAEYPPEVVEPEVVVEVPDDGPLLA